MQTAHELQLNDKTTMPYLLYTPDEYEANTGRLWPFILFLHGSGERGHDVELVRLHGLPRQIDHQPDFPALSSHRSVHWMNVGRSKPTNCFPY